MRVRLEKYYRASFVFCFSFMIQAAVIFATMAHKLAVFLKSYLASYMVYEVLNLVATYRMLYIKEKDKFRPWRRRQVTIKTK